MGREGGLITGLKKCFKLSYISRALQFDRNKRRKKSSISIQVTGRQVFWGMGGNECNIILDIKFSHVFIRYKDTR